MLKTIIGYTQRIAKQFEQTYQILLKNIANEVTPKTWRARRTIDARND
jgi:hypothetical protein